MAPEFRLTGLTAAPFTPLRDDGRLNADVIPEYAELLVESGVSGAFVCGTTGECHSLTVAERREVCEGWVRASAGRLKVVAHVGHNSAAEARELAAHAAGCGADAVAALAPSYYKPDTPDDLVEFCAAVAGAAAGLPFYYYHIPALTGVSHTPAEFLRRSAGRIPNLAGVKFTHSDLMALQEALAAEGGRFDVLHGLDEMLLAGLALGVRGAVGSTYNFAAPVYRRVMSSFEAGDLAAARLAQLEAVGMVRTLIDFGGLRAGKAVMAMMGVDCGPVRTPLRRVGADEAARLRARLRETGVFARPLQTAH